MIKITAIENGLKSLHLPADWQFKRGPGLMEQIRTYQEHINITRRDLEEAMRETFTDRPREREMVIHASPEGSRLLNEAFQREAERQLQHSENLQRERLRQERIYLDMSAIPQAEINEDLRTRVRARREGQIFGYDPYLDERASGRDVRNVIMEEGGLFPTMAQQSFRQNPMSQINPDTRDTQVRVHGQDFIFDRDMTEEQIIAHFDSIN